MSRAILGCFKTKEEAEEYLETKTELDKERCFIYHEPDMFQDTPYTVNYD